MARRFSLRLNLRGHPSRVLEGISECFGDFSGMRRQLSFGPFTLDADARQLVHGSDRRHVHLSPKAFDLLTLRAEARPCAISKQELRDRLWPSTFATGRSVSKSC